MSLVYFFFFFKQKTAYEMRISDWSSDVCSSDLLRGDRNREQQRQDHDHQAAHIGLPLIQVGGIKQRGRRAASRQRRAGRKLRLAVSAIRRRDWRPTAHWSG